MQHPHVLFHQLDHRLRAGREARCVRVITANVSINGGSRLAQVSFFLIAERLGDRHGGHHAATPLAAIASAAARSRPRCREPACDRAAEPVRSAAGAWDRSAPPPTPRARADAEGAPRPRRARPWRRGRCERYAARTAPANSPGETADSAARPGATFQVKAYAPLRRQGDVATTNGGRSATRTTRDPSSRSTSAVARHRAELDRESRRILGISGARLHRATARRRRRVLAGQGGPDRPGHAVRPDR